MAAIGSGHVKLINPAAPVPEDVQEFKDIEYGRMGERALQLDLYRPKAASGPLPGLIFIHGGAWSGGKRDIYKYYTVRYAQRGYVAATISYRLSGEAPFPAAVHDAKCAVRWMRANAAKHGVDPDRIAVIGGSAGGHLSMMVGYSSDAPDLEGEGGYKDTSSRVQAVVNFYGPVDLTTEFARRSGSVTKFLGGATYESSPESFRKASPLTYVTKDDAPTLILHGSIDDVVPISQAELLVEKLESAQVPYVYERFDGWPHAMDVAEVVNERCQWFMDRFLEKHLKQRNAQ